MFEALRRVLFPRPGNAEEVAAILQDIREKAAEISDGAAALQRLRSVRADVLADRLTTTGGPTK
jgi:hypothetical protein